MKNDAPPGPHKPVLNLRSGHSDALRAGLGLVAVAVASFCCAAGIYAAEQAKKVEQMKIPGINVTMVKIPKASFLMGHKEDFVGSSGDEKPEHKVSFTKDFWMGATAITVGQFRHFVETTGYITESEIGNAGIYTSKSKPRQKGLSWRNPGIANYTQTDDCPVFGLSWADCMQFCAWLTEREQSAGRLPEGYVYRLPTEAQWEYGARGNSAADPGYWKEIIATEEKLAPDAKAKQDETFKKKGVVLKPARARAQEAGYDPSNDPSPEEFGVIRSNSGGVPNPVGTKKPNQFGLYDMMGNGWNWVYDWYGRYSADDQVDPEGPVSPNQREIIMPHHEMRGGSWTEYGAHGLMTTNRWSTYGMTANQWVTFRIALSTVAPRAANAPEPGALIGNNPYGGGAPATKKGGAAPKKG